MLPSDDVNRRQDSMARVLVVDDEALTRTMLADIVRSCGHDAETAASGEEGLALFKRSRFQIVLTDVTMTGIDGIEFGKGVVKWAPGTPVILVSSNDELGVFEDAARRGFQPTGFIRKPLDRAMLVRTLERLVAPAATDSRAPSTPPRASNTVMRLPGAQEDDSQPGWLQWAGGPAHTLGPMRLLFVAYRQRATGQLRWTGPGGSVAIGVRGGDVVAVDGIPGLFRSAQLPADIADLQTGIQIGLSQGAELTACLDAATEGLATWLCALADDPDGDVRWDAGWTPQGGGLVLPGRVARWCGAQIARKSLARLESAWSRRSRLPIQRRIPGDTPDTTWGLDPLTLKVHRTASSPRSLRALLDDVANGDDARRTAGLRAIDLLNALGLLQSDDYLPSDMTTQEAPIVDPRVDALREASRRLISRSPIEVLDLADKVDVTEQDVIHAFREISRAYHPDTFPGAPPAVKALAEQCFAVVNSAYDALRTPGAIAELKKKKDAEKVGNIYANDREVTAARIAFRKGEVLWRAREFRSADPHLALAAKLDPKTWPYLFLAAQSGYYAKRLPIAKALEQLDALIVTDPVLQGEVQSTAGNLLKIEGRLPDALLRYKRALERDPNNRDALREDRLNAARAPAPPAKSLKTQFSELFSRKPEATKKS